MDIDVMHRQLAELMAWKENVAPRLVALPYVEFGDVEMARLDELRAAMIAEELAVDDPELVALTALEKKHLTEEKREAVAEAKAAATEDKKPAAKAAA
jgi:hypothetical protein